MFGHVAWSLWNRRNKYVFTTESNSGDLVSLCHSLAKAFLEAQFGEFNWRACGDVVSRQHARWELPTEHVVKINVDAAFHPHNMHAAMGLIACDSMGLVLSAQKRRIGWCSPLFAELWAWHHGLKWAWNNGLHNIVIESDSALACNVANDSSS